MPYSNTPPPFHLQDGAEDAGLRNQLRSLLAQPLLPSHTSLKFITHNPLFKETVHPGLALTRAAAAQDAADSSPSDE